MRASRTGGAASSAASELHISGAEGLYEEQDISRVVSQYARRALSHPRGRPDKIVLTVEEIRERPLRAPLLPVSTAGCASPEEARPFLERTLLSLGVSKRAVTAALKTLSSRKTLRGAALIRLRSGAHAEPDRQRGVRVSRLGIERESLGTLGRRLAKERINTATVREALALASKVAAHPAVVAEVCISDDPDYTTGYLASRRSGYVRIPHIKEAGDMRGGRVFFIDDEAEADDLNAYLERRAVLLYAPKP